MLRKDFVRGQVGHVPGPVAVGALNNRWGWAQAADFSSDVDVLNYALTLEYLESMFYEQGNAAGLLTDPTEKAYLAKVQSDEEYHVMAITQTIQKLGGTPVAKPSVDFMGSFATRNSFLTTSHTFENVGVGAYLGAVGYLKNKDVLQAAAGIFGVEARHAAIVGNLLGLSVDNGVFYGAFEKPLTKSQVLADVKPFLVQMAGGMPKGPVNTGGGATSGLQNKGLLTAGGVALLGAAGAAGYAATRRDEPATVTEGGSTSE